jgi:hypothetical protein
MAFKCLECGHIFEEGEQARWEEHHPYGMGYATESFSGCPVCKGDYEETERCAICRKECLPDELDGGVCEECIDSYRYNIDICVEIGKQSMEEIEINGFLASMYSIDQIESLLWKDLVQASKEMRIDCSPFIDVDSSWFAERLTEEVKKDENTKS